MRNPRTILLVVACLLMAGQLATAGSHLYKNLPKDPLLVVSISVEDPADGLDDLVEFLGTLGSGEQKVLIEQALARVNTMLGVSLQDDLLTHVGPEITAVLDLPPIDELVAAFQSLDEETLSRVLGRIGLLAEVRDARQLDRALQTIFRRVGGRTSENGDVVKVLTPLLLASAPDAEGPPELATYYAIRKGRLALGFSEQWVREVLGRLSKAERLGAGEDFARVFTHLDADPGQLFYVNLPRVRELVHGSVLVKAVLAGDPASRRLFEQFVNPETMGVGIGSTSVAIGDGVRTTHFGPPWLSALMSNGLFAAVALPDLMAATEGPGNRESLSSIRSIAAACEGFSSDTNVYPGPTDGWVPVKDISSYLEPVYHPALPDRDAFNNPILYWSNGDSYRILSTGRDGRMDQDWSTVAEPVTAADANGDIVLGDRHFLVIPDPLDAN